MRNLLQKLPFPVEFAVVVAGAFGLTIVSSALALLHHHTGSAGPAEMGVWRTVGLEAITLVVLGAFLWGRGWTGKRMGLDTHWIDGLWGLALAAGSYVAIYLVFILLAKLAPSLLHPAGRTAAVATPALTPYAVGALVLVNAVYEEVFVAGYAITALKEKSLPNLAINLSIAIRLAAHLFQGTMSLVLMIPIGLIFGTWYVRSGRLWPLILAHVLLNAWSYAAYIKW